VGELIHSTAALSQKLTDRRRSRLVINADGSNQVRLTFDSLPDLTAS
jgi:hypothetical protein